MAVVVFGLLASCREPTQITLELSTDIGCKDLGDTSIYVGTAHELARPLSALTPAAVTKGCIDAQPGHIGAIVVLPSGSDDERVSLRVVTGRRTSNCTTDLRSGCIEARRSLGFVPHTPLRLPVMLSQSCENVVCDNAADTCLDGRCVPNDVVCSGDCTMPGADAGSVDASPLVDVFVGKDVNSTLDTGLHDAPTSPLCASAFPDAATPTYVWHFDNSLAEASNQLATPPLGNASYVPGPADCGTALAPAANSEIVLGTSAQLTASIFAVTLYVRTTNTDGTILRVRDTQPVADRWRLEVSKGNLTATFCTIGGGICASIESSIGINDGSWHRLGLASTSLGITLSVDGSTATSTKIALQNSSVTGALVVSVPGAIDELHFRAN